MYQGQTLGMSGADEGRCAETVPIDPQVESTARGSVHKEMHRAGDAFVRLSD
jgi:hypothetical protein